VRAKKIKDPEKYASRLSCFRISPLLAKVREDFIAELAEKGINIYEKVERRLA